MDIEKMNQLRSRDWFGKRDKNGFIHRSWLKNQGHTQDKFDGKPVIGICNTWSELTPCNAHLRELAQHVKNGVLEAGGFPLEFPVMSLGEPVMRPTAMLFRNLLSMDVEETIRANPLDGVVLLTGCDKTTPGCVMGAASVGLPTILLTGGPMLNGKYKGRDVGSGTDLWKFSEDFRSGKITEEEFNHSEECFARSNGHCMTMGTASTMACAMESMGLSLPGSASVPAPDTRRKVLAQLSGKRIVEMVMEDLHIHRVLTRESLENAVIINAAIGGSTNFVIHLLAIAGRLGVEFTLEDIDRLGRDIPLLANMMPSGEYLMEDFYYAGGLPVVIRELLPRLHRNVVGVNGRTVEENFVNAECYNRDVIKTLDQPLQEHSGIAMVKGNLCPDGAIIKPSAASRQFMVHRGTAVVFENIEDYNRRINDPELEVTPESVLVLKNVGLKSYPGMPEVGNFGLPKKMLEAGVTDMVRISDGRMSGTAFGSVFLHVSPEAAAGGNLALVRDGDEIDINVPEGRLEMRVSDEELAVRRKSYTPDLPANNRGYQKLFVDTVLQPDKGADLDFLVGHSGATVTRDSH